MSHSAASHAAWTAAPATITPGEGSFAAGTRIALTGGAAPSARVEDLIPGDQILALGGARIVMRIEKRQIDLATHPHPARATPIRFRAGALAAGRPSRDLLLPPEALLFFCADPDQPGCTESPEPPADDAPAPPGLLVPAGALVNGASIAREPPTGLQTWFTLELDAHDVVFADAAATASCREPRSSEPGRSPREPRCAPLLAPGPTLGTLRRRLATLPIAPADAPTVVGAAPEPVDPYEFLSFDAAHPVRLFVGDRELAPDSEPGGVYRFLVPPGSGPARLVSAAGDSPAPSDSRRLGVCVTGLELDGAWLDLEGPTSGPGFHPTESDQSGQWRWTDGRAWIILPHATEPQQLAVRINDWHAMLAKASE